MRLKLKRIMEEIETKNTIFSLDELDLLKLIIKNTTLFLLNGMSKGLIFYDEKFVLNIRKQL